MASQPRSYSVLIVDDDADMIETLTDILEHDGKRLHGVTFHVRSANSPEAANSLVLGQNFVPDVVLMDNNFTGVGLDVNEGVEAGIPLKHAWAATEAEHSKRFAHVRFVLFTSQIDADLEVLRKRAIFAGADDVIFKARIGSELPGLVIKLIERPAK